MVVHTRWLVGGFGLRAAAPILQLLCLFDRPVELLQRKDTVLSPQHHACSALCQDMLAHDGYLVQLCAPLPRSLSEIDLEASDAAGWQPVELVVREKAHQHCVRLSNLQHLGARLRRIHDLHNERIMSTHRTWPCPLGEAGVGWRTCPGHHGKPLTCAHTKSPTSYS